MIDKPNSCLTCPLYQDGKGFVPSDGIGSNKVLIVGESAGYNEMLLGIPFAPSAQAGSVLHRVLQDKAKANRNEFAIHNLISCRPFNDKLANTSYEYEAINKCRDNLDKTVDRHKPKVILALGNLPFKHLTGLQGKKLEIGKVRGYVFKSSRYPDCLVVPSLHPSFIKRGNPHLSGVLLWDLMKAVNIAQGKGVYILDPLDRTTFVNPLVYFTNPTIEQGLGFLQTIKSNPNLVIAYDIETEKSFGIDEDELEDDNKTITQIQFSIAKDSGIAFPWEEPFISISRSILSTSNAKIGWNNFLFDDPILRAQGMEINDRIDDLMWMFHHYQADLPLGLQFVSSFYNFPFPWKHYSGSNLPFYGIADVSSLHYIHNELPKQLKERGLWNGYNEYVYKLWPILVRTSERGLPINRGKQEEFKREIEIRKGEIEVELKEIIPDKFISYFPSKGYIREPKELIGIVQKFLIENRRLATEDEIEIEAKKIGLVRRNFEGVSRWCYEQFFNPNSSDQVSNYIKEMGDEGLARKLAVKIAKEERDKEEREKSNNKNNVSTSKGVILGLANKTGNKGYRIIVEYRELTKMAGAFIDGWTPSSDGRVHTIFTFWPSSGQLSSRNPNIQQGPVRTDLAPKFRECIEAKEGYVLVKLDYRSYHAKMLGFLAQDLDYIRLSSIDPHSYVAAHMVGLVEAKECIHWDDIKLREFLKVVKVKYQKLRDDQAKHAILGIGFGLSEKGCYDRYKEDFNPTIEEVLLGKRKEYKGEALYKLVEGEGRKRVKRLYDLLRKLFPKVFKWQERTIIDADKGWIDTPFGARRWFPAASEVKYDRYGNVINRVKGEQAEEALAFPVSNCSHYHLREGLLLLDKKGILEEGGLVNVVHDDHWFEMPEGKWEELTKKVLTIMQRRSTILVNPSMPKGFFCEVDVKIGKNMNSLKEYKI